MTCLRLPRWVEDPGHDNVTGASATLARDVTGSAGSDPRPGPPSKHVHAQEDSLERHGVGHILGILRLSLSRFAPSASVRIGQVLGCSGPEFDASVTGKPSRSSRKESTDSAIKSKDSQALAAGSLKRFAYSYH